MPLNPQSTLGQLINAPVRPGKVVWVGLRPGRRMDMNVVQEAQLVAGEGLSGDRYSNPNGDRQVTLFEQESLQSIASHLGREAIGAQELRRNILVQGINLLALKGRRFRVGPAILEASGECHPCSRLETTLGPGGYNASRGLGGITARVLLGGTIQVGDPVVPLTSEEGELLLAAADIPKTERMS